MSSVIFLSEVSLVLSVWWILPFLLFLLTIATGPLLYSTFWHRYYVWIALIFAGFVIGYYIFFIHQGSAVIHTFAEYMQFISLLVGLYFASSGIHVRANYHNKPIANVIFLFIGSVLSNLIGTTGASMFLIRPFIAANFPNVRPYQIVFFIFTVSNIGGGLTPIGDPPLFLGFLKGVPFFWTLSNNFLPWAFTIFAVLAVFYGFEWYHMKKYPAQAIAEDKYPPEGPFAIHGKRNLFWLVGVILLVFVDPNLIEGLPYIPFHGEKLSFIRESALFLVAFVAYHFASKVALRLNEFSFEPIKEVAFIFIGIFATMMPALAIVNQYAASPQGEALLSPTSVYWGTGMLSGFLDNAPTYLTFLAASMAREGAHITQSSEVLAYAQGVGYTAGPIFLRAISIAAVFFGAFTYVGNAPNFMVKSIAQNLGIDMPYFANYIVRYALPILLPIYFLVWLIFV